MCVCARMRDASVSVCVRAFALKDRANIKKDREDDTGVTRGTCVRACVRACALEGKKKRKTRTGNVAGGLLEIHSRHMFVSCFEWYLPHGRSLPAMPLLTCHTYIVV